MPSILEVFLFGLKTAKDDLLGILGRELKNTVYIDTKIFGISMFYIYIKNQENEKYLVYEVMINNIYLTF